MIPVEICINSDNLTNVRQAVEVAYRGGASRVELCAAMQSHGLTPDPVHIHAARAAFHARPGLMVMIRPRAGDFSYTRAELDLMHRQIHEAAQAGADGVVFGVFAGQ